jgi:hypothetical protein
MHMILYAIQRHDRAAMSNCLSFDATVQAPLDVGCDRRLAIPRRPDKVDEHHKLVATHVSVIQPLADGVIGPKAEAVGG